MTFVRKFSGDRSATIVCAYTCPEHGEFDAEVQREENGEAPDIIPCPGPSPDDDPLGLCSLVATWTPSPVAGRVRRVEVVRGKWEKPERKTYLDTRKLGEGQDPDEFWGERKKIWDEERRKRVKELLR